LVIDSQPQGFARVYSLPTSKSRRNHIAARVRHLPANRAAKGATNGWRKATQLPCWAAHHIRSHARRWNIGRESGDNPRRKLTDRRCQDVDAAANGDQLCTIFAE